MKMGNENRNQRGLKHSRCKTLCYRWTIQNEMARLFIYDGTPRSVKARKGIWAEINLPTWRGGGKEREKSWRLLWLQVRREE